MPLELDKRALDGTSTSIGHAEGLLGQIDEITAIMARSRRQIVFRPSAPEALADGATATVAVHMVDASGTTARVDSASRFSLEITAGTGTILTEQPLTFNQGVATARVRKDAAGTLTLGLTGLVVEGEQETGVTINTSATKDLT